MKLYFTGSYANGAINMPKRDVLFEELSGHLPPTSSYVGTQMDKASRLYGVMNKMRADLLEADVVLLHPSRMNTSYFEIREALTLNKEIWILSEPAQFEGRNNYPYSLPNFKFISMELLKPLLELSDLEAFLVGLTKGELKK